MLVERGWFGVPLMGNQRLRKTKLLKEKSVTIEISSTILNP